MRVGAGVLLTLLFFGAGASAWAQGKDGLTDHKDNGQAGVKYNWLDFGGNPQHDNFDRNEAILTKANVARLVPLWSITVGNMVDREPLYVHDLNTIAGKKDVVFVNTKKGECAAFDALTGAKIWMTPALCGKGGFRESEANCVIDPTLQYIFVYGTDGYVYKLKTFDGSEVTNGWPIQAHPSPKEMGYSLGIFTAKNGISYLTAKNSQGLGHIVTINLKDNTRHVFTQGRTTIVDQIMSEKGGACAWGRAGGVYDPELDVIYLATANNGGGFDPKNYSYGMSVLKLKYDGTSDKPNAPVDSYTAANVNPKYGTKYDGQFQDPGDREPGSTDPLILPAGICPQYPHLLVQGGKDAWVRIINRDDMSGKGAPGNVGGELFKMKLPQTEPDSDDDHGVMSQPTLYIDAEDHSTWVIVGSQSGICGLKFKPAADGRPALETVWSRSIDGDMVRNGNVNTATATATGLLFYSNGGLQSGSPESTLFCVDIKTGGPLWQTVIGPHHWASQIVASGMVFYPNGRNNSTLIAFTIDGKPPIERRSVKKSNSHQ